MNLYIKWTQSTIQDKKKYLFSKKIFVRNFLTFLSSYEVYYVFSDGEEYKIKQERKRLWEESRLLCKRVPFSYACIMWYYGTTCVPSCFAHVVQILRYILICITMLRDRNNCMSLRIVSLRGIGMRVFIREAVLAQRTILAVGIKCIYKRDYRPTRSMRLCKRIDSLWKIAAKLRKRWFPVIFIRFEFSLQIPYRLALSRHDDTTTWLRC